MITSKPRHGEPIAEVRAGKLYPTAQFQHYLDDLEAAINRLQQQAEDFEQRIAQLENP